MRSSPANPLLADLLRRQQDMGRVGRRSDFVKTGTPQATLIERRLQVTSCASGSKIQVPVTWDLVRCNVEKAWHVRCGGTLGVMVFMQQLFLFAIFFGKVLGIRTETNLHLLKHCPSSCG